MIRLPGDGSELLTCSSKPLAETVFPEIGCRVKTEVVDATFTQVFLRVLEVEGRKTKTEYRAVIRPTDLCSGEYLCDRFRKGDAVECVVVSYGDTGMFVAPCLD